MFWTEMVEFHPLHRCLSCPVPRSLFLNSLPVQGGQMSLSGRHPAYLRVSLCRTVCLQCDLDIFRIAVHAEGEGIACEM